MIEQILKITLVSASMALIWSSSEHCAEVWDETTSSSSSNLISFILAYYFTCINFFSIGDWGNAESSTSLLSSEEAYQVYM
jgi:hypothetical protein